MGSITEIILEALQKIDELHVDKDRIEKLEKEVAEIKKQLAGGVPVVPEVPVKPEVPVVPEVSVNTGLTAKQVVDSITVGWNLANSFENTGDWVRDSAKNRTPDEGTDYEKWWGNPVTTREMIHAVKEKGFNAVRVPVTWVQHFVFDKSGNLSIAPAFINRLKEVVNWILAEDMYCIINTHHDCSNYGEGQQSANDLGNPWNMTYPLQWLHSDTKETNPEVKETEAEMNRRFALVWTVIANEFKDYGDKLIFEGFNEIQGWRRTWSHPTVAQVENTNKLNQTFVDAVRATGGNNANRILCVETYASNHTVQAMNNFKVPVDTVKDKIIVQIHIYTNKIGQQFRGLVQPVKNKLGDFPVIVGEFGTSVNEGLATESEAAAILKGNLAILKEFGYKPFYWDSNKFATGVNTFQGLLNRRTLTWDRPIITAVLFNQPEPDVAPDKPIEKGPGIDITDVSKVELGSLDTTGTLVPNTTVPGAITTKPISISKECWGNKLNIKLTVGGVAGWARILRWAFYDKNGKCIYTDFFKKVDGSINTTPDSGNKGVWIPDDAVTFRLSVFNPWGQEIFKEAWYDNQFKNGTIIHIDSDTGTISI